MGAVAGHVSALFITFLGVDDGRIYSGLNLFRYREKKVNVLLKLNLVILVILATSSGVTKIILMQQDVDFFGQYGFTNPILIAYGATQLTGGALLIAPMTRLAGAIIVAITFLISAVVLIMAGNIPVTIFTLIALLMLGVVMKQSHGKKASASDFDKVIKTVD